jgi:pectinesterase
MGDSQAPSDAGSQDGSTTDAGTPPAADASCALGDASIGTCTNTAPHLDDAGAANETTLKYLAQYGVVSAGLLTDNWDPTTTGAIGDVTTFTATFTVAPTGGTHTTVQAAIDAAVAMGGTQRLYINVTAGTYREVVCVPANAPPITLYSTNADASQTVIVYNNYNGEAFDAGAINPCVQPSSTATTHGTAGSSTFAAFAKGFQAKNITFSNDVSNATLGTTTGTQAVALMTQADQIVLENIRALGHQDTLYIETAGGTVYRAYVKNSFISGDVDFIFGGATFVLDGCTINFASDRRNTGDVLSPSTDVRVPYGILVTNGTFTADPDAGVNAVTLGRAWDRSSTDIPTYVSTIVPTCAYPNGQALVRDSTFSGNYNATNPWAAAATTKRPFCSEPWVCTDAGSGVCPANRLFEFNDKATDGGLL